MTRRLALEAFLSPPARIPTASKIPKLNPPLVAVPPPPPRAPPARRRGSPTSSLPAGVRPGDTEPSLRRLVFDLRSGARVEDLERELPKVEAFGQVTRCS